MRTEIIKRAILVATVLMMLSSISFINAQFLYRTSHLFLGPLPVYNDPIYVGPNPNFFIGPKFGIEYNYNSQGGLDFFIAWDQQNWGPNKLHIDDAGRVGIGRKPSTNSTYRLEVQGDAYATGLFTSSDEILKRNVKDMEDQRLDYVTKLRLLKGKSYEKLIESGKDNAEIVNNMVSAGKIPKEEAENALQNLNETKKDTYRSEYGFIAQDVKDLFPELVIEDTEGVLAVNYIGLIPVLLEAIKDLQEKVEKLEQRIEGNVSTRSSGKETDNEILSNQGAVLYQNVPNPSSIGTTIKYELPNNYSSATLHIYNTVGAQVKIFTLKDSTKEVKIAANELTAGTYIYTLIVNGEKVDSKRMILTN